MRKAELQNIKLINPRNPCSPRNPRFRQRDMEVMKRYPEYKNSGVKWIGEIPAHWRYSRLKFHLTENSGGVWGKDDEFGNGTYVLRSTEITIDGHWDLQNIIKRQLSNGETERFLLKKNDLVITKSSGSQNHIGKTGLVDKKIEAMFVCYSNFVQRIRPKNHINSKFLHYFMNCPLAREQYKYQSETTTGLANLSTKSIDELLISLPPIQEQTQIANFLDRKIEQIDKLIHIKERQIELLQEQRTALINQVVTKGLDPNVEMKPSGVEWIGEIPKYWEVKRLKYVANINMGQSPPSEEYNSDQVGTPFLQGNAEFGSHHPTPKIYCPTAKKYAAPGDILLSVRAPVGAINIANQEYGIGRGLCAIRPQANQLEHRYAKYLLEVVRTELHTMATGSTYDAVTVDEVSNITWVIPPFSEQTQIANYLNQKIEQIDNLIAIENQKIQLLKKYRQSLISDAVTGKIDVRNEP